MTLESVIYATARSTAARRTWKLGVSLSFTVLLTTLASPADGRAQLPTLPQEDWQTDFTKHTVPLEEIVSGGPPKDGIPAIDDPDFVSVDDADDWLDDREPVIVVRHEGDARAYPYQVMIWHEIVNDEVGGKPLAVTYCPLCNTALVFEREHPEGRFDFGTTGRLRMSDLIMYDRQTETWWQQASGEAIVGELAGERLKLFPAQSTSWSQFKEAHPEGRVLSRDTGHDRPYGQNPYEGYDTQPGPFERLFRSDTDNRLPPMERVAAVTYGDRPVAYPFSALSEQRVVNDKIEGESVVVLWAPGTASALDRGNIADGRDVGSSGVFLATLDDRTLTFEAAGDGQFRDRETGSTWDVTGRAVEGPLSGTRLEAIPHGDYLWFAWAAFRPNTEVRR
ncbi:MAG: DUF3179 domain-containing protein [Gemmatimonadota bacterium]|nr:DUF3179 domain-containing protein [Gemmatimonadota bacterium]